MRIAKRTLVHIYAVIRQAELSLDAALKEPWQELKSYYEGPRFRAILKVTGYLGGFVADRVPDFSKVSLESRWRRRLIALINLSFSTVSLREDQIAFLKDTMDSTIKILQEEYKPPEKAIVNLRMKLYDCELLVEDLLEGEPEIHVAKVVEHFSNPGFIEHHALNEFPFDSP